MRIDGYWLPDDEGVLLPCIRAKVDSPTGESQEYVFLVDTGADNTTLTAELVRELRLPTRPSQWTMGGVGGEAEVVEVTVRIEFLMRGGGSVEVTLDCFAFVADNAIEMPLLGRDLTNRYTLIVDHAGDTVCLIGLPHRYVIVEV